MFLIVKLLRNIVKILQEDISPNQISLGFALGLFLGLTPGILMKTFFFVLIMILRVNVGSAFLAGAIFAIIGFVLDPLADKLGFFVLNISALKGLWTALYNMPIIPFTKFNNTLVMGNIVLSLILFAPAAFGMKKFIPYYRRRWRDKVANWKIIKILTGGKIAALIFD
ncbi:MAG: TIGR03546 family protein [Elusimicrobiota bacterium]|jgi:uncharacterized protein (TIGR03546 family)|nr:TIGR03546 family protein [Elusimicrobiota bacterium]